jgi:mannose-1-phosphate guanylyltransferase
MEHFYAVIMAGGGGTRLWPLSRKTQPKQMLKLFGEKSLFQMAVERLLPLIAADHIFVVTVEDQAKVLKEQAPEIPPSNFILEPMPKGTASVVGIAAVLLNEKDPESVMSVLTADHYIGKPDCFRTILQSSYEVASSGNLITLGITPTYPSTGYGYIHQGLKESAAEGYPVHEVLEFKEKPSQEIAQAYMDSGDYVWNSGMFIWRTEQILMEISRQMPALSEGLTQIRSRLGKPDYEDAVMDVWAGLVSETIDYGIMENAENVRVIPASDMEWLDIGGWDRFFDLMDTDQNGNLILAEESILLDTRETLVYQQAELAGKRLIAMLGMEDVILIETEDVILICPRNRAEEVRSFVQRLSEVGKEKFL